MALNLGGLSTGLSGFGGLGDNGGINTVDFGLSRQYAPKKKKEEPQLNLNPSLQLGKQFQGAVRGGATASIRPQPQQQQRYTPPRPKTLADFPTLNSGLGQIKTPRQQFDYFKQQQDNLSYKDPLTQKVTSFEPTPLDKIMETEANQTKAREMQTQIDKERRAKLANMKLTTPTNFAEKSELIRGRSGSSLRESVSKRREAAITAQEEREKRRLMGELRGNPEKKQANLAKIKAISANQQVRVQTEFRKQLQDIQAKGTTQYLGGLADSAISTVNLPWTAAQFLGSDVEGPLGNSQGTVFAPDPNAGFGSKLARGAGGLTADLPLFGLGAAKASTVLGKTIASPTGISILGKTFAPASLAMSGKHGIDEAAEQAEAAEAAGDSFWKSRLKGGTAGGFTALTSLFGTERLLGSGGNNIITSTLNKALGEGVEEGIQQTLSNAVRTTYNPETGIFEGVKDASLVGAALGAPFGGISVNPKVEMAQPDTQTTRPQVSLDKPKVEVKTPQVSKTDPMANLPELSKSEIEKINQDKARASKELRTPLTKAEQAKATREYNKSLDEFVEETKTPQVSIAKKPEVSLASPEVVDSGRNLRLRQKLSVDRMLRENVTVPVEEAIQKSIYDMSVSENKVLRGAARALQGFQGEAGTPAKLLAARKKMAGTAQFGKEAGLETIRSGSDVDVETKSRIWAALDPEQAQKAGYTVPTLSEQETSVANKLRQQIDTTTQANLKRGLINEAQAALPYIHRGFSVFEDVESYTGAYNGAKKNLLGALKGRKDVKAGDDILDEAITDPFYLIAKRSAESEEAGAQVDYGNWLVDNNYTYEQPRDGMSQLPDTKLYGKAAGRWVAPNIAKEFDAYQLNNASLNALNDILNAYDSWGGRKARKMALTVLNPAVRLGNQVSNRTFAILNGHNPIAFETMFRKTKGMMDISNPEWATAVKGGLTGTDITKADFQSSLKDHVDPGTGRKVLNWAKDSYGKADDRARFASYLLHKKNGYATAEALRLAQRGFQDYSSVGWAFDTAAKTPLIGNAFVRFAGDSIRIAKNASVDHPLRSMATVAVWANFVNMMSSFSGETEEEKKIREDRFGAPKLPGTDISMTVQTPFGEVNLARFMPWYSLNEVDNELLRFSPIESLDVTDSGAWNDPVLGTAAQFLFDRDFRDKSIRDPENMTYLEDGDASVKKYPELESDKRVKNAARWLFTNVAPMGREVDSLTSAVTGNEDIYGKDRTLIQSALRSMGVKVEQFGPEQVKKQKDLEAFFDGNIKRTEEFLKDNPEVARDYYTVKSPTRNRATTDPTTGEEIPGRKISDLVSPEKWSVIKSESTGKLFGFLKSEAQAASRESGQPLDPIYNLPDEQARVVLDLRSRPTGDDIEAEDILRATRGWYSEFEDNERQYYADNTKHFDELGLPNTMNERVERYGNVKHPIATEEFAAVKEYNRLKYEVGDETKAKAFSDTNLGTEVWGAYFKAKLDYINEKREIEGYPPITEEVFSNDTFGYDDGGTGGYSSGGYSSGGYSGGGSGGGSRRSGRSSSSRSSSNVALDPYKYAVSLTAGGKVSSPRVSLKAPNTPKVSLKSRVKQPKVSIKKSRI